MATNVDDIIKDDPDYHYDSSEDFGEFRALSRAAVASIVFAVLGLTGFFVPSMSALLLLGMAAGVIGYVSSIRYPAEISGRKLAIFGTSICLLLFVASTSRHYYVYLTEVPEGYERLTWRELQPAKKSPTPYSARALEFDGQNVFMEGYILQPKGGRKTDLKAFILVRDIGTCCFGGNPKPTHIVKVNLPKGKSTDWNMRQRKLAGSFHVNSDLQPANDVSGVYYSLEADELK